ncbi:hypothetical protein PV08_07486 [Exophiala spinifera]|uniref:Uncharacterized protein n=1 Tax=Exophiala spinifera TaxID=91928 RepID=A0A0D1ZPF9_9EURO|nr:uncharacterized protein PV08_07486 [Exophiala spinifera]KIW14702.1 hypothetical protein PV08_07486 [Exophiala spinifera]
MKLDGRRKHAYEAAEIQYRQQFILDALLRSIKYNDITLVQGLVEAIRDGRPLLEIAHLFQDNIKSLQHKMLAHDQKITISDLISLSLTCLSDSDFRPHGNSKLSSIQQQHHRESRPKAPSFERAEDMIYHGRASAKLIPKEQLGAVDAASTPRHIPSASAKRRRLKAASKIARSTLRVSSPEVSSAPRHCDPPPVPGPLSASQYFPGVSGWPVETCPLPSQSYPDQEQVYVLPGQPIFAPPYDHIPQRYTGPWSYTPSFPTPEENSLRMHYLDGQLSTPCLDFCNSSPQVSQISPGYEFSANPPSSQQEFQGHGCPATADGWPNQTWVGHK